MVRTQQIGMPLLLGAVVKPMSSHTGHDVLTDQRRLSAPNSALSEHKQILKLVQDRSTRSITDATGPRPCTQPSAPGPPAPPPSSPLSPAPAPSSSPPA